MTDPTDSLPKHKDDFGRVCDLEYPSPCFTALRPLRTRVADLQSDRCRGGTIAIAGPDWSWISNITAAEADHAKC